MPGSTAFLHNVFFFKSYSILVHIKQVYVCSHDNPNPNTSMHDTCLSQDTHSNMHTQECSLLHNTCICFSFCLPTVHTVSLSSLRALPFSSTLHHHNCPNSAPLSPTSVLSERCYHGNWLQLIGLKRHDWHTQLASARTRRGACMQTCSLVHYYARHSGMLHIFMAV